MTKRQPTMRYEVHNAEGERAAACVHPSDAAAVVAALGCGTTIQVNGRVVWREGAAFNQDGCAADSYDRVAEVALWREDMINSRRFV